MAALQTRAGQTSVPATPKIDAATRQRFAAVVAAVRAHGDDLLRRAGVMAIRPGYRFKDGWITREPAIVVTVRDKRPRTRLLQGELLPTHVDGVAVDVAPATPPEQV